MRNMIAILAAGAVSITSASAATIAITNSNFEAPMVNTIIEPTYGNWSTTVSGWTASGSVNTYAPNFAGGLAYNSQSSTGNGAQVANVINGSSLSQITNALFVGNTTYTLSADFGDRLTQTAGGSFAIFADTLNNIVATQTITFPGEGLWSRQTLSFTLDGFSQLIGKQIGIAFFGGGTQVSIDNIALAFDTDQVVTPVPGAIWLFGSVLAAGLLRRKRKA